MKKGKKKNIVYSTDPNYSFEYEGDENQDDVPVNEQKLRIFPDRRNRKGKTVTVISDFQGSDESRKELEKELKSYCGCGGSIKDGDILIQGNFVRKISDYLRSQGYRTVVSGI